MQLTNFIVGAIALPLLTSAAAAADPETQAAIHFSKVVNNCPFTVYAQYIPHNGGKPGIVQALSGDGMGYMDMSQGQNDNAAFRVGKGRELNSFLTFKWMTGGGNIKYELSDQQGNPFIWYQNKMVPENKECPKVKCLPSDGDCYSSLGHYHKETCKQTSLTLTLCSNYPKA